MWDSDLTEWDAMEMGPKRDIVGELAEAVRAEGMYYGVSNHRARGWNFFTYKPEYDTMDPEYADFYWPQLGKEPDQEWLTDWQARLHEVVDKYEPDMMWFDYGWVSPCFEPYKKAYTAYYYNEAAQRNQEVALIYKGDHLPKGAGVLDVERGKLDRIWPEVWMTDTTVFETTWGYVEGAKIKPVNTVLHDLIDIVSKNGVLLLNVGPKPDGTIPDDQRHVLIEVGKWLDQNGECIYSTRPFDVYKEGDDIRFTRKGDAVYAIFFEQPSGQVDLTSFSHTNLGSFSIQSVELLSNGQALDFTSEAAALQIQFPADLEGERAWVAKVTLSGIGYSAPKVKITQGMSGGQVQAHGTVYNFTDEVQSVETTFYANRQRMGPNRRVLLQPGESGDIQFEHRDQNHYGAQDMILPNIEHAVYDFSFGQKKPGMSPITTRAFPAISLKGAWLFNPDADEPEFAEFAYNDSEWVKKSVPGRALNEPKAVGWFRKHVNISQAWEGRDLFINLGTIADADTVYVNGHKVGEKGVEYVEFHFSREIRKFIVPAEHVNYGGENVIAVRVYNEDRYGGLIGPAGFISLQEE
jgi:alpha-L-fucosidase